MMNQLLNHLFSNPVEKYLGYFLACAILLTLGIKTKKTATKMFKSSTLERRLVALLVIFLFLAPSILTAVLQPTQIAAAQVTQRKITIGSSVVSATDVTYFVSFDETTASANLKGIVIQFCDSASGPLIGTACTGPSGFDINKATLTVAAQQINGSPVTHSYAINGTSTSNTLILTNATGNAITANQSVTFSLGTNATGGDGVTNPSATGTFYARILTYANDTTAAAYTDTVPGTHLDDGGIALSTANELSTTARVQEVLQFCVGTTDVDDSTTTIANNCASTFAGNCGTTVDLGVLDSSAVSVSPVPTAPGTPGLGNACNGAAMVQTNASNGVAITYFAQQDTGSGQLKVPGASCSGASHTDQCFNDSTTQAAFTAGQESFGVVVAGTNCNGTTTTAYTCDMSSGLNLLVAQSGYIGIDATHYGDTNGFAWDHSGSATPELLAKSTGPVDNETIVLKFAATPGITTPTGTYTVTSTYIATSTF